MALPDCLRAELVSLLGDIKLFPCAWPPELIAKLMAVSNEVYKHEDDLGKQLSVLLLAIFPPMPGEVLPEGITPETLGKVVHGIAQTVMSRLIS